MLNLIAQTTQAFPEGTPAWAIGLYVVLGAVGAVITGLLVLVPLVQNLVKDIKARQDRQSNEILELHRDQKQIALHTPAPQTVEPKP